MKKYFGSLILVISIITSSFSYLKPLQVEAANDPIVIVIDPGHGGTGDRNLGAQYNGFSEKEITLQVANAMKAELEKYDNVTVYLTRTTDVVMTLEDRAAFAKSVNADFMFSIHFNASPEHNYYGSEVWTSAFGSYYQKGQTFAQIESAELSALGLYQKGAKTKIGGSGKDYYGIIRASVARDIPCVIIEHAYLDHTYDLPFLKASGAMNTFGVADATAVAKYFKLSSSATGTDYSNYQYATAKKPRTAVYQDTTEPDVCEITLKAYDSLTRNALIEMTTYDKQTPIIYFSYSYDGGQTFSTLQMWDSSKRTQSFNVHVPGTLSNPTIILRAYNNYELFSQSNAVTFQFQ